MTRQNVHSGMRFNTLFLGKVAQAKCSADQLAEKNFITTKALW